MDPTADVLDERPDDFQSVSVQFQSLGSNPRKSSNAGVESPQPFSSRDLF